MVTKSPGGTFLHFGFDIPYDVVVLISSSRGRFTYIVVKVPLSNMQMRGGWVSGRGASSGINK